MRKTFLIALLSLAPILATAAPVKKHLDTSNKDVNSSDKRDPTHWRFIGDGKSSPVAGIKFQKQGYSCKAKRITKEGTLIGKEVEVQSDKQVTMGNILKRVEKSLGLPRTFDESSGNIKNIGTSLPVYQVLSKDRKNDYLTVCAIWLSGRVLYLGEPSKKK
jgi:hypothetical protein